MTVTQITYFSYIFDMMITDCPYFFNYSVSFYNITLYDMIRAKYSSGPRKSKINSNRIEPPITVFILLFGWICHWQRLVIRCPQCTNTSLDCHWSNSVTWLNPKLLIGQQGFVGSFLYNWSKSSIIKNNNIEFNCLYFSYLVDRKWCQPSALFLSCFSWNIIPFIFQLLKGLKRLEIKWKLFMLVEMNPCRVELHM